MTSGLVPFILCSGIVAGAIKMWMNYSSSISLSEGAPAAEKVMAAVPEASSGAMNIVPVSAPVSIFLGIWIWVLAGIVAGAMLYVIWKYIQKRKNERGFD